MNRILHSLFFAPVLFTLSVAAGWVLAGCGEGGDDGNIPFGSRGDRYCEVLLVSMDGTAIVADAWGTQGISHCPAEHWEALDPASIASDTGALAVVMNGPRYWLPNATTGTLPDVERRFFGDLEMRLLATIEVPSISQEAYRETTVLRVTTYTFDAGAEIYELTSPEGAVYVMQAMSNIVDPDLTLEVLSTLGARLELPAGWSYQARTLESALILDITGQATMVQDELQNSYQRR